MLLYRSLFLFFLGKWHFYCKSLVFMCLPLICALSSWQSLVSTRFLLQFARWLTSRPSLWTFPPFSGKKEWQSPSRGGGAYRPAAFQFPFHFCLCYSFCSRLLFYLSSFFSYLIFQPYFSSFRHFPILVPKSISTSSGFKRKMGK